MAYAERALDVTADRQTSRDRYIRPNWFTQHVFNRVVVSLTRLGVSVYGSRILAVRGRKTGQWRTTPVNLLEFRGQRYLVAPRGVTEWVRNIRATGAGELHRDRFERVLQQGTFNANPLTAAAGLSCLQLVAEGWATEQANTAGEQLRAGLRDALQRHGVAGAVLGECSVFQILLGQGMDEAVETTDVQRLMAGRGAVNTLRKAMLLGGVDVMRSGGFTSVEHGGRELETTVGAFDRALEMLQKEGLA